MYKKLVVILSVVTVSIFTIQSISFSQIISWDGWQNVVNLSPYYFGTSLSLPYQISYSFNLFPYSFYPAGTLNSIYTNQFAQYNYNNLFNPFSGYFNLLASSENSLPYFNYPSYLPYYSSYFNYPNYLPIWPYYPSVTPTPASPKLQICTDADNDGFTTCGGDCVDSDPNINPDAIEITGDGIDQNCDGEDFLFWDLKLESAVRQALGIDDTTIMTEEMALSLTSLNATNRGIENLTGLEYFTNLSHLFLGYNRISDISALSGLTNLSVLYLYSNRISDISALSGLTNLSVLFLHDNTISDISALSGPTNLSSLDLHDNTISDISALSGLTNLSSLDLHGNTISDISALSGLTILSSLFLHDNRIRDISALSGLTNLSSLDLHGNTISDISALSDLTNLSYLDLHGNTISDISALVANSGLEENDSIAIRDNLLNIGDCLNIQTLISRGAIVYHDLSCP